MTRYQLTLLPLLLAGCNFDTSTQANRAADAREQPGTDSSSDLEDANVGSDAALGSDAAPSVEIRLNINGPAHIGSDYPGAWTSDPGSGGACGGFEWTNNNPVAGTVDDALFYNVMYGSPLNCAVGGLQPGAYRVGLYFAEFRYGQGCPGGGGSETRLFGIELEGTTVRTDVNLFNLGGCTNTIGGHPHVETFDLTITDGTLNIRMPSTRDNAMVSAIEVVSLF